MRIVPADHLLSSLQERRLRQFMALSFALVICLPLISFLHEAIVALAALALKGVLQSGVIQWLVDLAGIDKVYASVMFEMVGRVQVQGISITDPIGSILHQFLPSVFAAPDLVRKSAWVSAVIRSGSPLLARMIIRVAAASILIFLGVALTRRAIARQKSLLDLMHMPVGSAGLLFAGLALQLRAIGTVIAMPVTVQYLEMMGLSQFLTKAIPSTQESYQAFVGVAEPIVPWLAPLVLLVNIYLASFLCITLLEYFVIRVRDRAASFPTLKVHPIRYVKDCREAILSTSNVAAVCLYAMLVALVLLAPANGMAAAITNYDYSPDARGDNVVAKTSWFIPEARTESSLAKRHREPSAVRIIGGNYQFEYVVNGRREWIRGVGYNTQYESLSTEDRIAAYLKDFRAMRNAGINTILGWDQNDFDNYTLAVANQYDIGVILPYHLPVDADYYNPYVRQELKDDILAWVTKFRKSPALRMWGIGNEVIHGMRSKEQRKAFADFYRDVADAVHEIDPDHPIIYREAEDVFVPIIKKALVRERVERPWVVYGMNIFTYRLKNVLAEWRKQGMDAPLVVSEFAPSGLQPQDRPAGYLKMWGMLRDHPSLVIGGFMYVWTTAGPEPLDRVYGLVDEKGVPTDGSLAAMRNEFLSEAQGAN